MIKSMIALLLCAPLLFLPICGADEGGSDKAKCDQTKKETPKEEQVVTSHTVQIDGKEIAYKATAGTLVLKDEKDNPKATIFYVSYAKEGVEDLKNRPITFSFNGGPGSSSVWLHLGLFGPRRVAVDDQGNALLPYHLVDNPLSLLDLTDFVFIDPVSTGYSRPAAGEDAKQFHGVDEDVGSISNFIRLFTTRNDRWESPKFLAGESYGTTRAAALAQHLLENHHMTIDGIMLISSILNFQTQSLTQAGNDLPYILYLPSFAATAWYHNKLDRRLQKDLHVTLQEVQDFALNEYSHALMQGDRLDDVQKKKIVDKVASYTGLSKEYVNGSHLRINMFRYVKELLRNQNRTVGRFDGRYKGIDSDSCGESFEYDPSFEAIIGVFTSTINQYLRADLGWKKDEEYKILANVWPWNYGSAQNQFLNVAEKLREVMSKNPMMKVYVASGYYDLATPYFATDYTFTHLGVDRSLRDNVMIKLYEGGHMMYLFKPSLIEMRRDLSQFLMEKPKPHSFLD